MLGIGPPDVALDFDCAINVRLSIIDREQLEKPNDPKFTVEMADGTRVEPSRVEYW